MPKELSESLQHLLGESLLDLKCRPHLIQRSATGRECLF